MLLKEIDLLLYQPVKLIFPISRKHPKDYKIFHGMDQDLSEYALPKVQMKSFKSSWSHCKVFLLVLILIGGKAMKKAFPPFKKR